MNKRIISLLLTFSFLFSVAMPAFAASNTTYAALSNANQSEIVSYIGSNKLVSWETQSTVYIKQYDLQGNLLVSGQGNKQSGEITIFDGDDTVNFNASRECFKTIKVTKPKYRQVKQRHENRQPSFHTG